MSKARRRGTRKSHDFSFFRVVWTPSYGWTVERGAALVVVPIAPDGRLWLERLHRVPLGTASWELPGGGSDGQNLIEAALRELDEECGLVARGAVRLLPTVLEAAPGMGRIPHHVVVARDVVPKAKRPKPQRQEGITQVRRFEKDEVVRLVATGRIRVLPTLGALAAMGWLR